jgi:hypothetical protein
VVRWDGGENAYENTLLDDDDATRDGVLSLKDIILRHGPKLWLTLPEIKITLPPLITLAMETDQNLTGSDQTVGAVRF